MGQIIDRRITASTTAVGTIVVLVVLLVLLVLLLLSLLVLDAFLIRAGTKVEIYPSNLP